MQADATYNGWKNRTTWATALWLANDEPTYWIARSVVLHATRPAHALEAWLRSSWATLPTIMRTDIGADLSGIDWQSVAESLAE